MSPPEARHLRKRLRRLLHPCPRKLRPPPRHLARRTPEAVRALLNIFIGGIFLALAAQMPADAEEVIPQTAPAGRYEAMRNHCPFAIGAPVVPPAAPQPSFAAN